MLQRESAVSRLGRPVDNVADWLASLAVWTSLRGWVAACLPQLDAALIECLAAGMAGWRIGLAYCFCT